MRRKDLDGKEPYEIEPLLNNGDYAKSKYNGLWCIRAPNGDQGSLKDSVHTIIENTDGTITVSPSIQFLTGNRYHGFLRNGEWSLS